MLPVDRELIGAQAWERSAGNAFTRGSPPVGLLARAPEPVGVSGELRFLGS